MGREYVRAFLKEGAKVVATDMSWAPSGVSNDDFDFLAEIQDNPNVLAEVMDITIDSHVKRVYEAAIAKFGTIDVIINNAGIRQRDLYPPHGQIDIIETDVGDWQKMFDTHVFGTLRVIKTFVQPMIEQKHGSIVNVCSGGFNSNGTSREGSYQPAKAAEITMAMYLAHELKPYNIAVNVLTPGLTASTGTEEQDTARRAMRAAAGDTRAAAASRRMRPDNVVPLGLFLAEQDASGTTGQIMSATRFNQDHELGGFEVWGYGPDVEAHRAAGTL
jgi:NAD(P)-dependent dehydrogenase (short-subunit alcohol dehydrogenase family)